MDIVEIGKKVCRFQKERVMELGVELTPELVFFHLSEEIGEIARQLVNRNLSMREYEESNLKEEIAQTILDMLVLSQLFNIDLPDALNKKMNEMAKKAVGSLKGAGVGLPSNFTGTNMLRLCLTRVLNSPLLLNRKVWRKGI